MELWQKQLIRSIFHYSPDRMKIDRAFMIKNEHVPHHLYKYRQFSPNHLDALMRDVLWLSSPDRLNDPFEAMVSLDDDRFIMEDQSLEEFIAAVKELRRVLEAGEDWQAPKPKHPIRVGDWWRKQIKIFVENSSLPIPNDFEPVMEGFLRKQSQDNIKIMSDGLRKGFSVLSLSATANSKLLWAHHSNSHTGFVIEYDFAALPFEAPCRRLCFPVFYTKKLRDATRYLANPGRPFNNLFGQYMCLIKHHDWAYEQEWRIVMAIGPDRANFEMTMPKPSGILLGSRVDPGDKKIMSDFCRARSIPLRQMKQGPGTFELTAHELDLN